MGILRSRPADKIFGRVVIVDDDPGVRRALARLVRSGGYEVRTFGSAEELLDSEWPTGADCLVLDVYLGGITGFDLYHRLATLPADPLVPPTVFITAHDDAAVTVSASRAGATCLRKPIEGDSLLAAIAAAIGQARR